MNLFQHSSATISFTSKFHGKWSWLQLTHKRSKPSKKARSKTHHMACPNVFDSKWFPALPRVYLWRHLITCPLKHQLQMSEGSQGKEEELHLRYSPLELMCHLLGLSSKCNHAATSECSKPGEEEGGVKWTSTPQSGSTGSQDDSGKPQLGSSLDLFGSESNSQESGNVQETNSLERSWDSLGKRQTSSLDLFASSSDEQTATTSESKNVSHPQKRVRFNLLTSSTSQDNKQETSPGAAEEVEANRHFTSPLSQPKDVLDMFKCYSGCEPVRCSSAEPYRMGRVFRMVVHWGSVKEGEGCITRAKWYVWTLCGRED